VSIHTLTMAAYQLIRDINAKRGGTGMLVQEQLLEFLTEEGAKLFRQKFSEAENFFKHANRDPEAALDFNPGQTALMLADACTKYRELTGESLPLFGLYMTWFGVKVVPLDVIPETDLGIVVRDKISPSPSFGQAPSPLGRE
jgi:hypothetical protein